MNNMINWFEIPATDFGRAKQFYGQVLQAELQEAEMMGMKMAFFPSDGTNVSGAVVHGDDYIPSANGPLVYLNGGEDLEPMLQRVVAAGGKMLVPKTQITPELGYFAMFIDTEGNKLALHSMK